MGETLQQLCLYQGICTLVGKCAPKCNEITTEYRSNITEIQLVGSTVLQLGMSVTSCC